MIPSHPSVNDQGSKVPKPLYNIKEEDFSKLEPTSLLKPSIDTNASLLAPLKANKTYQAYTSKSNQENVITGLNGINEIKNHQNIHHLNNNNNINKNINKVKTLVEIKQEDVSKVDQQTQQINQQQSQPPSLLTQTIENNTTLLTPLKAPKSYGTYSKQQQEDVIAFIKDGNSLRTAEKVFGIPKSTMHCWLKKIHNNAEALNNQNNNNNNNNNSHNNNNNNNNNNNSNNNNSNNNNNSINSIHHNSNNHQHHISNNSSNNSSPVEHFSDLNIDTHFPYSTVNNNNNNSSHNNNNNNNNNTTNNNSSLNGSCPDYYSGTKVKQLKNNHHNHQRKPNPSSQIVIEESELIRFLQSNEGMEMIAKAYCVTVHDFLEFIQHTKAKTQEGLKGLLVSTSQTRPVEVIGFIPNRKSSLDTKDSTTRDNQPISPNTARKRNLQVDVNGEKVVPPVAVLQKKIKVEHNAFDTKDDTTTTNIINNNTRNSNITNAIINNNSNNSSLLASLLTKGSYKNEPDWKPVMPTKVVLTTKQYLAASKIINAAQPNLVNTFLSPKPLAISADGTTNRVQPVTQTANTVLMCSDQSDINNNCNSSTETLFDPTTDLALAYPKITNPVSIKAERLDSEITLPCDVSPNSTSIDCIRTFTPVVHSITRPTVTSNNTATLNLNEINRTQSERELMAMVGGDNVSADELCAEFKETLELSNWVDNETWYMDQYLQHFQVSPAITSPGSSLPDAEIEDLDEGDNNGLTFAVDKDKEKIRKSSRSSLDMDKMENIVPVTVNIFEPYKSSGEVWTTLSSPPGLLNSPRLNDNLLNSPNLNDELLSSPRMNDGLLCSPVISEGLCSPRLHDRGLLGSPHKEQLLTHLHETGLDPNLIQPNFNSFTNQNSTTSTNEPIDEKPTVLRGTKFHSAFYRPNKTFERTTSSAFTKSVK